ncbi:Valyl-tRNA synthetase [Trachipleistophora hominis]|uniref:Probable valine--tRNA ligase, cytoplasmic n=1 Tax=Trachipleistophora hominis TaxID=72359 RepID=L7JZU4_TRAHO|nr:Valyl-tRNA synthetase [Trachipleistophora hominis]
MGDRKQQKELKKQKKLEKFIKKQSKAQQTECKKNIKLQISQQDAITRTPEGELKNVNQAMGAYDPMQVEEGWYSWWDKKGFFKPEILKKHRDDVREPYVMALPPPNVTGKLHIGHAMMVAIEDAIARYKRMQGFEVLFVPGCDHAGIATQTVVEKKLYKEKRLTRYDLGREKFIDMVWKWKEKYGDTIIEQIKRLGTSVDMGRYVFTLDKKVNEGVIEAFVQLYERKLIYRESKLINWCSKLSTALSDLEVDHKPVKPFTKLQVDGKKYVFGVLYAIKYPLADKGSAEINDYVEIATTRPETIIGDTALCVNPMDKRAQYLRTKVAINPITKEVIPIIFDEYAEMEFGTGVVKITPAHDFNDYDLAKKHGLAVKNVLNENNEVCVEGSFYKMKRFYARIKVLEYLRSTGLFVSETGYEQTLPICSRSGDVLEPHLKKQWWLDCKGMARKAIEAVESKELKIVPDIAIKNWNYWLSNIRDWCLSRQLWWGHQIPAYEVLKDGESAGWVVARTKDEAKHKAETTFKLQTGDYVLRQDEDVLDTWFSSGLWPFVILGWPAATDDFARYFPNSILETGSDILFFWVARMVMLSLELTGKVPFNTILLHGIVRDANGRKMSKSLGNVIDPLYVIEGVQLDELAKSITATNLDPKEIKAALEGQRKDFPMGIPRCGSDALRFTLCSYTSGMKDVNLNILRADGYRKFCNKLWNAFKFVLKAVESTKLSTDDIDEFEKSFLKSQKRADADRGPDRSAADSLEDRELFVEISSGVNERSVSKTDVSDKLFVKTFNKVEPELEHSVKTLSISENGLSSVRCVIEWLYGKREAMIEEFISSMDTFNFMSATQCIHQFALYTYCDVFIEVVKQCTQTEYVAALVLVFRDIILLLHPFMPFITEELFQRLRALRILNLLESITVERLPRRFDHEFTDSFSQITSICRSVRSIMDSNNLKSADVQFNDKNTLCFEKEMRALCRNVRSFEYVEEVQGRYIDQVGPVKFSILPEDKSVISDTASSSETEY